jgi:hypothetical protein
VALLRDESVSVVTVGTAPAQTGDTTRATRRITEGFIVTSRAPPPYLRDEQERRGCSARSGFTLSLRHDLPPPRNRAEWNGTLGLLAYAASDDPAQILE